MINSAATQKLLQDLSASLDENNECRLQGSEIEPLTNLIAPLTQYGFLNTEGPDSAKFLQGQTTCDLKEVDAAQSRAGAFCNVKGRMISSFRLSSLTNPVSPAYLMRMRRDLVALTQQTLSKYIVFSKAQQTDASDQFLAIGLRGAVAAENIESIFQQLPGSLNRQIHRNGNLLIQLDDDGTLFECWLETGQLAALWPRLSKGLTVQGSGSWDLLMIRQGIGEVCAATTDQFIPQMLNYQTTGAISFTKGCYTGQEVVARMQYKGTMKRQMYRVLINSDCVRPGDALFRPGSDQSIGNVVNTVARNDRQSEALAVITIKDVESNQVVAGENSAPVEVLSLPYAITV